LRSPCADAGAAARQRATAMTFDVIICPYGRLSGPTIQSLSVVFMLAAITAPAAAASLRAKTDLQQIF
jgi:hypothetical protein